MTDGQTDRRTLRDSKDRAYASHRAVKMVLVNSSYSKSFTVDKLLTAVNLVTAGFDLEAYQWRPVNGCVPAVGPADIGFPPFGPEPSPHCFFEKSNTDGH